MEKDLQPITEETQRLHEPSWTFYVGLLNLDPEDSKAIAEYVKVDSFYASIALKDIEAFIQTARWALKQLIQRGNVSHALRVLQETSPSMFKGESFGSLSCSNGIR